MPAAVVALAIVLSLSGLAATTSVAAGDGGVARPAGPTRVEVQARLEKAARGLSARDVADLGAGAGGVLARIADDKTVAAPIRLRAMAALAYARAPASHDFLESYLARQRSSRDPIDRALLRKAAIALGWQSGPRTVEALAELLDHDDAEVRLDTVVALGLTRTRRAEKPLRDRLAIETDAGVRAQIESQLRVLLGPEAGAASPP
jgi:HEAT repeat protein